MLHLVRAYYVAKLWKSCVTALVNLPSPLKHGWIRDGGIQWTQEAFQDDDRSVLVSSDHNDDEHKDELEVELSNSNDDLNIQILY